MNSKDRLLYTRTTLDNLDVCFYFVKQDTSEINDSLTHKHAWHEIHIVKNGTVVINVNRHQHILNSNQALLLSPQTYHTTYAATASNSFAIGFELTQNNKTPTEHLYERMINLFRSNCCTMLNECDALISLYNELTQCLKYGETALSCRVRNILTMFLFKLSDKLTLKKASPNQEDVSEIDSIDKRNYLLDLFTSAENTNNVSLSLLSQSLCITPKQANRIIKKRYNKTYKQKQIELRIENAKNLLLKTSDPVDKIAQNIGYSNITSFYKTFKKMTGVTPKEYRKRGHFD